MKHIVSLPNNIFSAVFSTTHHTTSKWLQIRVAHEKTKQISAVQQITKTKNTVKSLWELNESRLCGEWVGGGGGGNDEFVDTTSD